MSSFDPVRTFVFVFMTMKFKEIGDWSHNGIYIDSQSLARLRQILEKMILQSTGVVKEKRF